LASLFFFSRRSKGKLKNEKEKKELRMTQAEPTLPSNRAFVVQFQAEEPETQAECTGRVEHVVSGQATRFQSWEHLQRFMHETLTKVEEKPP
jgi:hypothetical protein